MKTWLSIWTPFGLALVYVFLTKWVDGGLFGRVAVTLACIPGIVCVGILISLFFESIFKKFGKV